MPKNLNIVFFDIETAKTSAGYATVDDPIAQITSIALKNKRTGKGYIIILDTEERLKNITINALDYKIIAVPTEEELLLYFYKIYEEFAPDIITGWNIDRYDIPYLYNRTKIVLDQSFANKLSPIGIVEVNKHEEAETTYKIAGVSSLDYIKLYKSFTYNEEPSYALDFICKKELGHGKIEYTGSLHDLFLTDPEKFVKYNGNDVDLVIELDDKLDFINLAIGTCIDGYVDFESIFSPMAYLDGAGLAFLRRKKLVADNKKSHVSKKFQGAVVLDTMSGLFKWVYDLDLTSLYPSIIRSLNISPETLIGKISNWSPSDFISRNSFKQYSIEYVNGETFNMLQDELFEYLKLNNYSIAANGAYYRNDFRGFIPSILDEWFNLRVEFKDEMKKYKTLGDVLKSQFFHNKQLTQKIKLNTFYGVQGNAGYRFYNLWNAEAITLTGQFTITTSKDVANRYYQTIIGGEPVNYVIAGDTDSVYLSIIPLLMKLYPEYETWTEEKLIEVSLQEIQKIQKEINDYYHFYAYQMLKCQGDNFFEMKQELLARAGFWMGIKKRYGLSIVNEEGVSVNKLETKGLDNIRSDFPRAFRDLVDTFLDLLLNKLSTKEQMNEYLLSWYSDLLTKSDKTFVLNMMFPTSVNDVKKYDSGEMFVRLKGAPIHVKSSLNYNDYLKYKKLKQFSPITNRQKIKWTYLKKNNELQYDTIAINEDDFCDDAFKFILSNIDIFKNINTRLINKLQTYYDALGWGQVLLEKDKSEEFFNF